MFTETALIRSKHRSELVAQWIFGFMAFAMVVPLLLILSHLISQALPLISWDSAMELMGTGSPPWLCAIWRMARNP